MENHQQRTFVHIHSSPRHLKIASSSWHMTIKATTVSGEHIHVKSKEGLWAFIHGKSRFSGLQSPLGITNGNRSHNKPLELI